MTQTETQDVAETDAEPEVDPEAAEWQEPETFEHQLLRHIREQGAECDRLARELNDAKEAAKAAKEVYEGACATLRAMIRRENPDTPLLDGTDEAGAIGNGTHADDDDSWRDVQLNNDCYIQLSDHALKCLAEAGIETVGQLADWTGGEYALTDIRGIGPEKAKAIEDALDNFWATWGPTPDPDVEVEPADKEG